MKNKHIQNYRELFSNELNKLQDLGSPSYLYKPIKHIIKSEGKRLRPIIVQFLGDLFNNNHDDVMNAAMGVELLHNFTLVHDDIMDEDELRHNVETIHQKWDNAHAVLAGDGLGALGPIFIGKIKKNTLEILIRYNEVILEICEGQAYDMEFESREASVDEYLLMSAKKTGALFELCFEISSLISDDYVEFKSELKALGRNLGIIFQIQDDILEMSTSSENMGKGTSSDIERKKKTILSSIALDHNREEWNRLQLKIKDSSLDEKKAAFQKYYDESGVIDKANELLLNFEKKCKDIIKLLPENVHNDMNDLLKMVVKRKN